MEEPIDVIAPSVDSHLHLALMKSRGLDIDTIIRRCCSMGMEAFLDIGLEADDLEERLRLGSEHPNVWFAIGVHPTSAHKWTVENAVDAIRERAGHSRVVAIGEIGLDYFREDDSQNRRHQQEIFEAVALLAEELRLPIAIHNREANQNCYDTLRKIGLTVPIIMHCFSSNLDWASRFLELGAILSFAGNITYKKNDEMRKVAAIVPNDQLLVETDAPFLAPREYRGSCNHPGYTGPIVRCLAEARNEEPQALGRQLCENFRRLLPAADKRHI